MITCTRVLEWDCAHRVMRHESKCRHLHGHRYKAEITCEAPYLDDLGRVVDFSVIKTKVGGWIDEHWDHGTLACRDDHALAQLCEDNGWKYHLFSGNPTAENIAAELFRLSNILVAHSLIRIVHVRVYETPNCWADYIPEKE